MDMWKRCDAIYRKRSKEDIVDVYNHGIKSLNALGNPRPDLLHDLNEVVAVVRTMRIHQNDMRKAHRDRRKVLTRPRGATTHAPEKGR